MEGDLGWFCSSGSNNWDLHAVVRFACSGSGRAAPPPAPNDTFSWLHTPSASEESSSGLPPSPPQTDHLMNAAAAASQPLLADPAVDDLCLQAFFASPKPDTPQPSSPTNQAPPPQRSPADAPPGKPRSSGRAGGGGPARSKRKSKKSQVSKEVTRVPVGGPPADLWAWRKYGQKPIKGSPYPRGYYRCSTDKDCKARKQVERCRADPGTLIVSYTGEHSHPVPLHRNSLAGTTRNKAQPPPPSSPAAAAEEAAPMSVSATKSPSGSRSASTGLSPGTPLLSSSSLGVEYKDDEEDDAAGLLLEDMELEGDDHVLLYLMPEEMTAPVGPVHGSACDDVMLFPKPDEAQPTTSTGRTDGGGAEAAPVMNIGEAEEKFSISGLSAWEDASAATTSSWG
ncbi:unnamed protein product [Urochloa decumbens]|uniref:WRKY domain-containing protein n=1 Tax=Urochloa decumbens TaxID=240449 RepID=A0ABC9E8J9_9POAL